MARSVRSPNLETRSARLKLPIAKKPIFVKIGPGLGLGYRRNATAGTWVVREADGAGGNWTKAIGIADDLDDADGSRVLDFWQAQDRARGLGRDDRGGGTGSVKPATVGQVLDAYEADLKMRSGDIGNVARVRMHLPTGLFNKAVALLASRELRKWRDGLARTLAAATVNRTTTGLKAALNLAAEHDERITNRRAWETGLATIPDAEQSRNVILSEAAVRQIIVAAQGQSGEFGLLIEVAAVTGARVSQLSQMEVQDLQAEGAAPRLMMPTSRKGKGKKIAQRRPVPIPHRLAAKLRMLTADRSTTAPLLIKPSGAQWKKSDHCRPFARAARTAGQNPEQVTMYALRHSSIVRQILAGVPIRVIAVNHDTSIAMLERTYSRHIGDHSDALARIALLDIAEPIARNVVPIRATAAIEQTFQSALPGLQPERSLFPDGAAAPITLSERLRQGGAVRSGGREGAPERWNVPDWRDEAAYPKPDELSDTLWRWEFIRRMHDYRIAWDRAAPIEYELNCQEAEKSGRDKRLIRKPDDIYFTVSSAAYSFPDRFTDLIKYKVHPIHNPRLNPPRVFEGGPSILRYEDEDGGFRALAPKPKVRQEPVTIPAGWTMIGIDLTEPIRAQWARAQERLKQLQADHAEEWNFVDRLNTKESARRRKTLWPCYIRVLDARDEGVSYQEIGVKLKRLEELTAEIEGMGLKQADAALDRIERAKSDAKKWHKAALRVANNDAA